MGAKHWSVYEDDVLLACYFDSPMSELLLMLPGRSRNAILSHAKVIGVERSSKFREATQIKPTHGMSKARNKAYAIWCGIRQRCEATYHKSYHHYGGRGIKRCHEWDDFEVFYRDMGEPPAGAMIGRINNDKGYSKENCRWETAIEQANNRRSSRFLDAFGKRMTVKQWSNATGIKASTIEKRIDKYGWSITDALTKSVRQTVHYIHHLSGRPINE